MAALSSGTKSPSAWRTDVSGLYVIFSKTRQEQLTKRRNGYQQYMLDDGFGYVREDHNSAFLGERQSDRVLISPQWTADIEAVAGDPHATFFFVDNKHQEAVSDAIRRGLKLPVSRTTDASIRIDQERRLAADLKQPPRNPGR
ncbi:hypothetical protein ACRDNQ_11145 [Palleronia sp. KMU-117]|uniref:hypothetical protein n=1 Tax=Palleronia sp. KMU-117 TaxID=3434108 RepID=UPI003D757148